MRCFNHQDLEAVGSCKHCMRAVCNTCARINDFGLSCCEACDKHLSEYDQAMEKSLTFWRIGGRKKVQSGSIFTLLLGLVFTFFGAIDCSKNSLEAGGFLLFMGIIFAGYAAYNLFINKNARC